MPVVCAAHPFMIIMKPESPFLSSKCPELLEPVKTRLKVDDRLRRQISKGKFPKIKVRLNELEKRPGFKTSLDILRSLPIIQDGRKVSIGELLANEFEMQLEPRHQAELQSLARKLRNQI